MSLTLPQLDDASVRPGDFDTAAVRALYVHVPFCFHKCHYCDFYSITRQTPGRMHAFVGRVLAEATRWGTLRPETVFFGGGTPSLLPPDAMARLLDGLHHVFDLSAVREWTVEVNPATADEDYFRLLASRNVNRVSLGAQSFDPRHLRTLERHHNPDDVPRALDLLRSAGIGRDSLDLIYAIPGQTADGWRLDLDTALALGTGHLSCYSLTYEPQTPLEVRRRLGRIVPTREEDELEMFCLTRRVLARAGMPAYEVSNHARPGRECVHNLHYWRQSDYVGLGPSAASHLHGTRFRNTPHLGRWEQAVDAGRTAAIDVEQLPPDGRAGERVMLGLRTSGGVDGDAFAADFGTSLHKTFPDVIDSLHAHGLIEWHGTYLRLTQGAWHVADAVAAEFVA